MTLLFVTLCKYEMTAKHTRAQIRSLKRKLAGEDPSGRPSAAARRRA